MTPASNRDDFRGGVWLLADMSLNIWALSIVKWLGADIPTSQIVFMRAFSGLCLIAPIIWLRRNEFAGIDNIPLHLVRVILSAATLMASFFALPKVPLALFTAAGFTRPIVTMLLAAVLLHETIGKRRWIAAVVAFAGILIAVRPGDFAEGNGLAALAVVVLAGSGAVIATRRLRDAPFIVMMAFYTAGIAVVTAPLAALAWAPVSGAVLVALVLVGLIAQSAQFCFLRAHYLGSAGFLSILSYSSLIVSTAVGYVVFAEVPGWHFAIGAGLVICATLWASRAQGPR